MNQKLVNILINKNYTITFAESCTGGLLCSRIVEIPSASQVLKEAFITYSDNAKNKYLNVSLKTIEKYDVVSEEVAKEMAIGAKNTANSQISISVTGIAGPAGYSKDRPVGMVCFGFCILDDIYTETKYFGDIGRNNVREAAANYAVERLISLLE